jgi:hypothetical protein
MRQGGHHADDFKNGDVDHRVPPRLDAGCSMMDAGLAAA